MVVIWQVDVQPEGGALIALARDHPQVMEELVLVLRALQTGQGVALDGLPNKDMREALSKLLSSLKGVEMRAEGEMMEATYYYTEEGRGGGDGLLRQVLLTVDQVLGPLKTPGQ